jgi:hypothetical protein
VACEVRRHRALCFGSAARGQSRRSRPRNIQPTPCHNAGGAAQPHARMHAGRSNLNRARFSAAQFAAVHLLLSEPRAQGPQRAQGLQPRAFSNSNSNSELRTLNTEHSAQRSALSAQGSANCELELEPLRRRRAPRATRHRHLLRLPTTTTTTTGLVRPASTVGCGL